MMTELKNGIVDPSKKVALYFWKNSKNLSLPPKGLVWLVHGVGEHLGRYNEIAHYLTGFGFDVAGIDHLGHGLTAQKGGFKRLASFPEMLHEQEFQIQNLFNQGFEGKGAYRPSHWFLVGHSMGALLSLYWIVRGKSPSFNADFAKKAFISAPPLKLQMKVPAWKEMASQMLSVALPDLKIPNGIELSALSYNLENQKTYDKDPLVHRVSSPRNYESMKRVSQEVMEQVRNVEIPVCIALGADDPIIDTQEAQKFYESMGTHKKFLKFEKRKHEIFNDNQKEEVWAEVKNWLTT